MVGDSAGNVTRVCDGKLLQYPRQKFTFHTDGCMFWLWFVLDDNLQWKNLNSISSSQQTIRFVLLCKPSIRFAGLADKKIID